MLTLRLEGVSLGYGKSTVLRDINFEVKPNEIVGVIGPNGSGKSTLIRGMTRLITPGTGKIYINGHTLSGMKHGDLARTMAVVPQNASLPKLFTGIEVVLMGRTPHLGLLRYEGKEDFSIVKRAMEFTRTTHLADRKIGELSGGEMQRLIIARAIAQEAQIILLDEPTTHLDINFQIETLELIRRLCREQKLIVVAALHDLNLAAQYCDRLVILHNGKIHSQGTPDTVINSDTIKEVYGANVFIYPHPVNNLPATLIVSNTDRDKFDSQSG